MKRFLSLLMLALASIASAQVTIPWPDVSKAGSNLNEVETRNYSDLQGKPTTAAGAGWTNGAAIDTWGTKTAPSGTPLGTTDTQTVTNKNLTSATNVYRDASTTVTGAVELATDAEADALSSSALGVTPAALGYALRPRFTSRASADFLYSDGVTNGRRIETVYGAVGALAGSAFSEVDYVFDVPTSAPSGGAYIVVWSSGTGIVTANSIQIYISGNDLAIIELAATAGDYRQVVFSGWRTANSGRRVRLTFAFTGDSSTTAPVVYQDGVALSGGVETSSGAAPNWAHVAMATTYHHRGFNWPAGYFRPGRPVNRKYAQADVDFVQLTGRLPALDALGGSAVGLVTGDNSTFASDTGFWTKANGATISGGAANLTGGANANIARAGLGLAGRRCRLQVTVATADAGAYITDAAVTSTVSGGWAATTGTKVLEFVVGPAGGIQIVSPTGVLVIDDLTLLTVGALSDPIIQPIQVVADATPNGYGSLIVGFIPVTSKKDWIIQARTSTNGNEQILGGSVFGAVARQRIGFWTVTNGGSSRTVSFGNASAGAQYLSGGTAGTGQTDVTLLTRFNATNNLWVNSNGTDVLVHTIFGHGVN